MLPLAERTVQCEVVCYCSDVGQGAEMDGARGKAKATGASSSTSKTCAKVCARLRLDRVKANAPVRRCLSDGHLAGAPVIAKRQIEIARRENADAVAHGSTAKETIRFDLS